MNFYKLNKLIATAACASLCSALLTACGGSRTAAGSASASAAVSTQDNAGSTAGTSAQSAQAADTSAAGAAQDASAAGASAEAAAAAAAASAAEASAAASTAEASSSTEVREHERPAFDGYVTNADGKQLQIVFLGDSQFDNFRDETGIAFLVMKYLQADIYNLSMGGTTFSLDRVDNSSTENWNARCGLGIAKAIAGQVSDSFFDGYEAHRQFAECDFSKTDVFVIEYGVNDFLANHPHTGRYENDPYSYTGAITDAVQVLKEKYPSAKVLICTPTYAYFNKSNNQNGYTGDSNMTQNNYATLADYAGAVESLTQKIGADCYDAYDVSGITNSNYDSYLLDGIHMNEKGRRMYAQGVCRIILREMGYTVEEGKNLDELDFSTLTRN